MDGINRIYKMGEGSEGFGNQRVFYFMFFISFMFSCGNFFS